MGISPANGATPELVVGLKQVNTAVVPTVIPKDVTVPPGKNPTIRAFGAGDKPEQDALSTFGSFSNQTPPKFVTLGVFFATGVAAQNISQAFQNKVGTAC